MACFAAPPLFPPQITFTENQRTLYALDVQNQRAFSQLTLRQDWVIYSWLQKKFPYAKPGSPEAENYVELSYYETQGKMSCQYSVHWQYTTNPLNNFPSHWTKRTGKGVETKIGTYIPESDVNDMVQGDDVKIGDVELNYWKSTNLCNTDDEGQIPCHQSYFMKGTESPFELAKVKFEGWRFVRVPTQYTNVTVATPKESYFVDHVPKNWQDICQDVNLGLMISPGGVYVSPSKSDSAGITLYSPPHNDEDVTVTWAPSTALKEYNCTDCAAFEPKTMVFTKANFNIPQTLTVTYKKAGKEALQASARGGGYESMSPVYDLYVTAQNK
jgi:hypothetical protein